MKRDENGKPVFVTLDTTNPRYDREESTLWQVVLNGEVRQCVEADTERGYADVIGAEHVYNRLRGAWDLQVHRLWGEVQFVAASVVYDNTH